MNTQTPFSVCFTGHRPEKMPADAAVNNMLQSLVHMAIIEAIEQGADTFYSGLARGVDTWAAEDVLWLRKHQYPHIRLIGVSPFPEHTEHCRSEDRYRLNSVVQAADRIIQICDCYRPDCYSLRNRYLVSHSQYLIGILLVQRSGTGQTVRYAKQAGLTTKIITLEHAVRPKNGRQMLK